MKKKHILHPSGSGHTPRHQRRDGADRVRRSACRCVRRVRLPHTPILGKRSSKPSTRRSTTPSTTSDSPRPRSNASRSWSESSGPLLAATKLSNPIACTAHLAVRERLVEWKMTVLHRRQRETGARRQDLQDVVGAVVDHQPRVGTGPHDPRCTTLPSTEAVAIPGGSAAIHWSSVLFISSSSVDVSPVKSRRTTSFRSAGTRRTRRRPIR